MQYHTCPDCGANLDPGERCDCQKFPGLTRIGDYSHPMVNSGKPMPLYEMDSFINTLEGNNLFAAGDMDAYRAGKAEYEKAAPGGNDTENGTQNRAEAPSQADFTTGGPVRQIGR